MGPGTLYSRLKCFVLCLPYIYILPWTPISLVFLYACHMLNPFPHLFSWNCWCKRTLCMSGMCTYFGAGNKMHPTTKQLPIWLSFLFPFFFWWANRIVRLMPWKKSWTPGLLSPGTQVHPWCLWGKGLLAMRLWFSLNWIYLMALFKKVPWLLSLTCWRRFVLVDCLHALWSPCALKN